MFTDTPDRIAELNRIAKGKKSKSFGDIIAIILIALVLFVFVGIPLVTYMIWAYAFVTVKLWAWFVVPFFSTPAISMAQAYGFALILGLLTYSHHTCKAKDERETYEKVIEFLVLVARPWGILLMGCIARHFLK